LHLLASALPWTFGVVTPRLPSGIVRGWDERIRPRLPNIQTYQTPDEALRDGEWHWILAHNVSDLMDCARVSLPKIFLMHGTLSGRIAQEQSPIDRSDYLSKLSALLRAHRARVVYVSALKQADWRIPGDVIRPAVDPSQYGGYGGNTRGILQVCNHLRERGEMMGWQPFTEICRGLPHLVLGKNPRLQPNRMADSWDDLKAYYRGYRIYLYTAQYPHEDGYNLALLEAMATGMPVATLSHPTSPVEDGISGLVASTPAELRERLLELLDKPEDAVRIGRAAQARVEREFSLSRFRSAWQDLGNSIMDA
jgi:glycosyltransferase involved in cell wall biosynthesis